MFRGSQKAVRKRPYVLALVAIVSAALLPALALAESLFVMRSPLATPMPDVIAMGSGDATGPIYTTADGRTLYTTGMDEKATDGVFGCTDARYDTAGREGYPDSHPVPRAEYRQTCIDHWQPFLADAASEPIGLWSIVERPDGQRQWAYDELPLYTSTRDGAPGDINGTMGFDQYGAWQTVGVELWFPPGIKLVRKLDGLLLATENDGRLIFTAGSRTNGTSGDWIPMFAPALALSDGTFDVVRRDDGTTQWAFKGMPLYRPREHVQNHEIQQHVAAGQWQPVVYQKARERPRFLTMQMSVPEIGWVYATGEGRTMYAFFCFDGAPDGLHCDEPGDAAAHRSALCGTGAQCAREWRPVLAEPGDEPVGNWGIAEVPDPPFVHATDAYGENVPTVRAWTYHGRPVYTFAGDRVPGDVLGHGIDARSSGFGALTVLGDSFPVMP